MSTPITCPKCGTVVIAPGAAAGGSVPCTGCGTAIPVPKSPVAIPVPERPVAIPVAREPTRAARPSAIPVAGEPSRPSRPPAPADGNASPAVSVWVWRGLGVGAFVAICLVFALIGAALNPDEPGLGASRMARKVGAPLALLLIGAVELVLWLRKRQSPKRE